MVDLPEKIEAEREHVETALANLEDVMRTRRKSVVELAATATFLHNIYNGVENILKQILKAKNLAPPKSETWHKELLETSVSKKIISEDLADKLREYLAFRHFFIHGYGFMLDEVSLKQLADDIPEVWVRFTKEIGEYLKNV